MRGNDLIFAFPSLVIAILITAVFGPSALNAILAIGIFNIPVFARVTRGGALPLWTLDYILAARVAGKGRLRISLEHILPNILNLLIVQGTIQFSLGILAEAALSYVGLGAQPPTPSWGRMLADAQTMIYTNPTLAILPGLAIVVDGAGAEPDGRRVARPARPAGAAGARMIRLDRLSLAIHGTPILRDVSLDIAAGQGLRAGRRKRLGQVDDRAGDDGAAAARRASPPAHAWLDGGDLLAQVGARDVRACAATRSG